MSSNHETYRRFCKGKKSLPIFHQAEWLDRVCGKNQWDIALSKNGDHVTGVLPYQKSSYLGFTTLRQPPLCPYLGPLIFPPQDLSNPIKQEKFYHKTIEDLLKQLPKSSFTRLLTSSAITNPLPFIWNGYRAEYSCTYIIESTNEIKKLWNRIDRGTQKKIKDARIGGIQVRPDSEIQSFFKRHKHTYKSKGLKINYDYTILHSIYEYFHALGKAQLLSAYGADGVWQASIFLVLDASQCYYLLGARSHHDQNAMFLLWWEALEKYSMNFIFNFEGSLDRQVGRAYRSCGAKRVDLFNFSKRIKI